MKTGVVLMTLGLTFSAAVFAECPSHLDTDQLVECITVEGSGANYQGWKKKHDKLADSATTSPITGEDVATVAPAAGKVVK